MKHPASAILLPLLCAAVSAIAAAAAGPEPAATNAIPNARLVPAADLRSNPDRIHFDTPSQRTLGLRYAEAFLKAVETTASGRPQPRSGGTDR